jgi:hypothetical protein
MEDSFCVAKLKYNTMSTKNETRVMSKDVVLFDEDAPYDGE